MPSGYQTVSARLKCDQALHLNELFREFIKAHFCGECEACRNLVKVLNQNGRPD